MRTITELELNYVKYLCSVLPPLLEDINYEIEKNDHYLYQSENRARFNRLRIELNKTLMDIAKQIYGSY